MINCKICETYCCWFAGEDRTVEECPDRTPATNADRIRSMTDEELAKYLDGVKRSTYNCTMPCNGETCVKCWLDWLKEEVKD